MTDSLSWHVLFACVSGVAVILLTIAQVRALCKWKASVKQLRIALADIRKRIDALPPEGEVMPVYVYKQPAECLGQAEYYEEQDRLSRKSDIVTPKGGIADAI